jgi:hypothetical protein
MQLQWLQETWPIRLPFVRGACKPHAGLRLLAEVGRFHVEPNLVRIALR